MGMLDDDRLIGPVSLAIVMTIQARFVIAAQESLLRIFGGALDGLAGEADENLRLIPADAIDPLR